MRNTLSVRAIERVIQSLEALRNGRAMYTLLSSFCVAGLLLAMAESALVRNDGLWGAIWSGLAFAAAFFGINATGILLMDQALGRSIREVGEAVKASLFSAHRVLACVLMLGLVAAGLLALLLGLLWGVRLPGVGPAILGAAVPLGVVMLGSMALVVAVLIGPLTGPSVWHGQSAWATTRWLSQQVRRRLLEATLLVAINMLVTALVSAVVSFVVMGGARAMSLLTVWGSGLDLPPQQLMAGLFGYGLRSLGAAGAPAAATAHGMAALVGGGVVFALALMMPTLVYLRGSCSVYLMLRESDPLDAPAPNAS